MSTHASMPLNKASQVEAPRATLAVQGAVATISMNRPASRNAIDVAMGQALLQMMRDIDAMPAVRVIVLRGEGQGFCAGGDLSFIGRQGEDMRGGVDALMDVANAFVQSLRLTPRLVLVSVHGAVAGGGLALAMAGDFCIAAEDSLFVPGYAQLGVSPDIGLTANLARAIGARRAMQVMLMETRLSATEAERLGMVNRVVPRDRLEAETAQLAQALALISVDATAATKALFRDGPERTFDEQLDAEREAFQACIHTPAAQMALQRFLQA